MINMNNMGFLSKFPPPPHKKFLHTIKGANKPTINNIVHAKIFLKMCDTSPWYNNYDGICSTYIDLVISGKYYRVHVYLHSKNNGGNI